MYKSKYTTLRTDDVKLGDKVRLVVDPGTVDGFIVGDAYEVVSVGSSSISVKLPNGSTTHGWMAKRFEKVTEAGASHSMHYFIALEQNGQYAPSTTPKQYRTLEQAETVAKEMSERHGKVFYVLQPVAKATPPIKVEAKLEKISL
jgi:hypothetical protein